MSISVQQLTKLYGSQKAVNGISFTVGKGEIVGFLGPNGAGKSTTMKMITGYLQADGGTATVCDQTVSINNLNSKKKIGYLPELNPLYTDMYVREYLAFVGGVHQVQMLNKKIEEVIITVGLQIEANKKIGQLSKGYKQRVGLAAALIHNPDVLILDEPTTGLDPNQIIEIREVIKQLGKDKTVLFSSHILQEVQAICDRVIIINKGNIVADDLVSNLQKVQQHRQQVSVLFKENITMQQLHSITANNISQLPDGSLVFDTDNAEAVKKQLLAFSIDANVNIISLQSNEHSLEDIFRSLTHATN
jgi:ABC-2 type transport system ATP-binding protein